MFVDICVEGNTVLERQLWKVDPLDRIDLLHYRKQNQNKKLDQMPLVITYTKHLPMYRGLPGTIWTYCICQKE